MEEKSAILRRSHWFWHIFFRGSAWKRHNSQAMCLQYSPTDL